MSGVFAKPARLVASAILLAAVTGVPTWARTWTHLGKDGVHDPSSYALIILQHPQHALQELPPATGGDQVDWVRALDERRINPRAHVSAGSEMSVLDLDVLMKRTGTMAYVKFSHRIHTEWLDCSNCHEEIFHAKIAANARGMAQIILGKGCGQCHGTVAFPWKACNRCHDVPRR